jgi:hypothetical protein
MENQEMKNLEAALRTQKFNSKIHKFELETSVSLGDWLTYIQNKLAFTYPASDISSRYVSRVFKTFVTTDQTLDQIIAY